MSRERACTRPRKSPAERIASSGEELCRADPLTVAALALPQGSLNTCLDLAHHITASPHRGVGYSKIRGQSLASTLLVIFQGNTPKSDKYAASK